MAYFIFKKNSENLSGTLYKIAENQTDLNSLNIDPSNFKIIEDSQSNFDDVKYGLKSVLSYSNNTINYLIVDTDSVFATKTDLKNYLDVLKNLISIFLENNKNHSKFNVWNSYYNQLNGLNVNNLTYPITTSLEQYFKDQGQPSYNILQLP